MSVSNSLDIESRGHDAFIHKFHQEMCAAVQYTHESYCFEHHSILSPPLTVGWRVDDVCLHPTISIVATRCIKEPSCLRFYGERDARLSWMSTATSDWLLRLTTNACSCIPVFRDEGGIYFSSNFQLHKTNENATKVYPRTAARRDNDDSIE